MCKNDKFISYYKNLHDHNYTDDIKERECASDNSMCKYYVEMNFKNKITIYESFTNDEIRTTITRWILSNHDIMIETGRHKGIPRNQRICDICE